MTAKKYEVPWPPLPRLLGRIQIALKTVPGLNAREHPMARAKRVASERQQARMAALVAVPPTKALKKEGARYVVALTRFSPGNRMIDDDNLLGALKHVRDGVADRLQVDDGDTKKVRWKYQPAQRGPWGVLIEVFEEAAP